MESKFYELSNKQVLGTEDTNAAIQLYTKPSKEELDFFVQTYQIDEHTLISALDPDETARFEFEPSHTAFIIKYPNSVTNDGLVDFKVLSLGAFLFEDKLIFVRNAGGHQLFREKKNIIACESLKAVLLRVIYDFINQFMRDLRIIHHASENIEEHIEYSLANKALSEMFTLQKGLVYYQSALQSNQLLLHKLKLHAGRIGFTPEEIEYLDDIIVENEQCLKLAELHSHILTDMSDARVSIINNNLTVLLKKLTIISTIFLPLNLIASMGGMSEWTNMTKHMSFVESYGLFIVLMVVIGLITWFLIKNIGIDDRPKKKKKKKK